MFPSHLRSHGRPHLFRDPGCDLVIPANSLDARCSAARHETRRCEHVVINCTSLDPVAASYKIKARKASSTTRRKLSAQQLRTGHGWARERQLGTMVDTQFLFALLRWWSSSSNQTMSRHRVSLQNFASFYIHRLPATIRLERHRLSWHNIECNVKRDVGGEISTYKKNEHINISLMELS